MLWIYHASLTCFFRNSRTNFLKYRPFPISALSLPGYNLKPQRWILLLLLPKFTRPRAIPGAVKSASAHPRHTFRRAVMRPPGFQVPGFRVQGDIWDTLFGESYSSNDDPGNVLKQLYCLHRSLHCFQCCWACSTRTLCNLQLEHFEEGVAVPHSVVQPSRDRALWTRPSGTACYCCCCCC